MKGNNPCKTELKQRMTDWPGNNGKIMPDNNLKMTSDSVLKLRLPKSFWNIVRSI